jgi:hypothetical protein
MHRISTGETPTENCGQPFAANLSRLRNLDLLIHLTRPCSHFWDEECVVIINTRPADGSTENHLHTRFAAFMVVDYIARSSWRGESRSDK